MKKADFIRIVSERTSLSKKDVANVILREKDENFIVRNEGKPGMNLVIRKKKNADIKIIPAASAVRAYNA